jgi:hypothetical protein
MIYKNGFDLSEGLGEFIKNSSSLYIFVPYIKLDSLNALISVQTNVKAVFVRWETKDLILGSSDLEIYPYLKARGIALYRNPRLHLKAYLDGFKKCFLTSANISSRALNLPLYSNYNYEIGTIVEDLGIEDRLYFNIIESDSMLITDNIFKQLSQELPEKKREFPNEVEFTFKFEAPDKDFLISSLPMTIDVETLMEIYEEKGCINEVELNCVLHDLATYKIPFGLPIDQFRSKLEYEFFNHPFIKLFLDRLNENGEMFFGEVKMFIHHNCCDVPLPRRWEITENIQILYRWFVTLGNGKYKVDVPNSYSQRLSIVNQ